MSRSALWRQEGNVKERERLAEETYRTVVEEGRARKSALPLWGGGTDDSFHLNPLLLHNIVHSPYFQKCCQKLRDWSAIIDEIYYEVKSLQPFQGGGGGDQTTPSTAFCLLLRLLTLRMTPHQMDLTLKHADSPYIRGIGFLYLRYAGVPQDMWGWIQPYLYDPEELTVDVTAAGAGRPQQQKMQGGRQATSTTTMGEFVRSLFSNYHRGGSGGGHRTNQLLFCGATPLPRLPAAVERDLEEKLRHADAVAERALEHVSNAGRMRVFQTLGSKVMALYGDEHNPITWYTAEIDRVLTQDPETGHPLKYPKFIVTFSEYGNTETVHLGEIDTIDGDWNRERKSNNASVGGRGFAPERRGGGGNSSRSRVDDRRADDRPERFSGRRGVWDDERLSGRGRQTAHTGDEKVRPQSEASVSKRRHTSEDTSCRQETSVPASRKRSAQETAAIQEKKRKLMAKYG